MNKIEEIEELITVWKAVEEHGVDYGMGVNKEYAKGKKEGFEAALDIFRRPSNKVVEDGQEVNLENDDINKITEHYQEMYKLHKLGECSFYSECIFCEVDKEPSNTQLKTDRGNDERN